MATSNLTAQRLREILDYDPNTGLLTWKVRISQRVRAGDVVSCIAPTGYVVTKISGRGYLAHRLAWLHVHGEWPKHHLDHIDGNRINNRISNLREATNKENCQNKRSAQSNNVSGMLGVSKHKGSWSATIAVNGERRRLGTYPTPELAHEAYIRAKRVFHPHGTL